MPTIFSHPVVPVALALGLGKTKIPRPLLMAGIFASILPDFDVVAFRLGISYADILGHRGLSHAFVFALLIASLACLFAPQLKSTRRTAFLFVLIAGVSHSLLDMLTNGGLGVAFFWPFTEARYFFPIQVIEVSPISPRAFISSRGLNTLKSEFLWIWVPCILFALSVRLLPKLFPDQARR